jgi:crotonobetainyl-CoA:carnitine CoA-transferase CaiB-like acyl-CoA transferase
VDDRALSTLRGLRVVELASSIPAAWCGRQFAQWGADVVARSDSPLRSEPPIADGVSLLWLYVSEGKRLVGDPAIAGADVVIADHPVDAPDAVVVLITPFGTSGPYASYQGTDLIVQALSGYMSLNGLAPAPPLKAPANIGGYACGTSAFAAALPAPAAAVIAARPAPATR